MKSGRILIVGIATLGCLAAKVGAQIDNRVTSWMINTTGQKGHSTDATINGYVSQVDSDVRQVYYTSTNVYVKSSDVPSHDVGPFAGNPAYPADQSSLWRISRTPAAAATHAATPMGPIGVMVNGAEFFNAKDAATYNNGGVWHQNAVIVEGPSFDAALGHPAPQGQPQQGQLVPGAYHYHEHPAGLQGQLHDDATKFSPLLGFAFDGFPIYGAYGSANTDGTGGVKRMTSSYRLRSITQRHSLPDGTTLASNQWGPDVSAQYPLGYYVEDYEYAAGLGDLDQYNGRFTITPDFPSGTYAYFATIDANGAGAYPYLVGPTYYGTAAQDDLTHSVTIPANATLYVVPEPAGAAAMGLIVLGLSRRGRQGHSSPHLRRA